VSNLRNIVIVGGDFACTTLARALERQRLPGHRVVLISEESYTTFNPMLSEVVGASVFPEHVVAPMRQMLRPQSGSQFVMGRVSGVDFERRPVHASTLAGVRQIAYEHLVLAFGSRANLDLLPGLAQHALPLKLVGDAMHIRNRVLQRVAAIELETDPVARRRLGRFIVIGGGLSSVEVAGAIHDVLRGVARYYPRVQPDELAVTLLENGDRLLPELAPSLGRAATRSVRARHRPTCAWALGPRGSRPAAWSSPTGECIAAATVVCTIGTRPNPLLERLGLPALRGRLETAPDLAVVGAPHLWAIGDCASCASSRPGATRRRPRKPRSRGPNSWRAIWPRASRAGRPARSAMPRAE
jgi:NADH dehydrogenase